MSDEIDIADHPAAGAPTDPFDHLYLIYDPNVDGDNDPSTNPDDPANPENDAQVIRGGPNLLNPELNPIEIQDAPGTPTLAASSDRFNSDTSEDRNVTTVLTTNASVIWTQMLAYANAIQAGQFDYDIAQPVSGQLLGFMANSNSVVASVLSSVGIDVAQNLPLLGGSEIGHVRIVEDNFPGAQTILVAPGNWTLQGFETDNLFIESTMGGSHTLYGGDTSAAVLNSTADGFDMVRYDEVRPGTITVFNDHRTVADNAGSVFTDTLYSTEGVYFLHFNQGNSVNYSHFGQAITVSAISSDALNSFVNEYGGTVGAEMFGLNNGFSIKERNGTFDALNIGKITGTAFDDHFNLFGPSGLTIDGGGHGAAGDTVDYSADTSSGLTVNMAGANGTVTDGTNTDTLTNVQNITGTAGKDNFTFDAPDNRVVNGDGGGDTVKYTSNNTVFDENTGFLWNGTGTAHDTLEGIDPSNSGATRIVASNYFGGTIPDNNFSQGTVGALYDFSTAAGAATVTLNAQGFSNLINDTGTNIINSSLQSSLAVQLANGVSDSGALSSAGNIYINGIPEQPDAINFTSNAVFGTNHHDTVTFADDNTSFFTAHQTFYSGDQGADITMQLSGPVSIREDDTTVEYRGGDEVIHNAGSLTNLELWNGISLNDLSMSTGGSHPDGGYDLTLTINPNSGVTGSITLEDITGAYHPNVTLESGGGPSGFCGGARVCARISRSGKPQRPPSKRTAHIYVCAAQGAAQRQAAA